MPPETPPAAMRDLARQLLLATQAGAADQHESAVIHVTEQLRTALTTFAGTDSFTSLLRRTLVLARAELPAVHTLTIGPDGRLQGLEGRTGNASMVTESATVEATLVVVANLLWLLSSFIGTPLTIRLIQDVWPSISLDPYQSTAAEEA